MENKTCPIWGTMATPIDVGGRDGIAVNSPRAGGKYFISGTAKAMLANLEVREKVLLTSWLVTQHRLGVICPVISNQTLEDLNGWSFSTVHERADELLRYLAGKSELLGTVVKFCIPQKAGNLDDGSALLAWTSSRELSEVTTLVEYAQTEKWIEYRVEKPIALSEISSTHELMLRPLGYARLAALDSSDVKSSQAFVAMWFDQSMNEAYEKGIAPAIRDAGYDPVRIDQKDHNNKIDDEIVAELRRSRFVVADFTHGDCGARGGVYYEAGFAHGLNIPVIFTCRTDTLQYVHFDTRQYNHIAWESIEALKNQLSQRISATIGDGPKKKNV